MTWKQPSTVRTSPVPTPAPQPDLLDFPGAIRAVMAGSRVTREAWADRRIQIFLWRGVLHLQKADGSLHQLIVSDGDLYAEDWQVVDLAVTES